jgi:hypothetical protein
MLLGYVANQVNEPWLILMIAGLGIGLAVSMLWSAFEPKAPTRRYDRRKYTRHFRNPRRASISGRFS